MIRSDEMPVIWMKWWDASDMNEIRSNEMHVLCEFVFIDAKGGVK
jgi:hypothetical protein